MESHPQSNLKKSDKISVGRWIAMKSTEFGWVAGPVVGMTVDKIEVRVKRRRINDESPSFKDLIGWEEISGFTAKYWKESKSLPRIVLLPIIEAKH